MVKIDVVESFTKELMQTLLENRGRVSYLIMNDETEKVLEDVCVKDSNMGYPETKDGYYATYWGVPIAKCNKLAFGEIELI